MKHGVLRLGVCCSLLLGVFAACGVDQRALTFEYHALDTAGSSAHAGSAGRTSAGSSNAGNMGDAGAAAGGDSSGVGGTCASCGGKVEADAGAAGTPDEIGGTASTGGSASGGSAGSAAGPGGSGASTGGGAGSGGVVFPCGDLNLDAVDDCQQTLVQNSRFDSTVEDWVHESAITQAWDASNASGKPGSGSIQVSNTAPVEQAVGALTAGSHQCIPVTPLTNYDFAARVMLAAGQTGGQAGVTVWLFDDVSCNGNLVTGDTPIYGGVAGSWTTLKGKLSVPGGVYSMWVRLVAIKPFTQATLSVFIDDVLVAKR